MKENEAGQKETEKRGDSEIPIAGARRGLESPVGSKDYQTMAPGSVASEGNLEPAIGNPESVVGKAHYAGFTEEQAREQWEQETICFTCLSVTVCKIATGIEAPLAAVTRCLAYLPMNG